MELRRFQSFPAPSRHQAGSVIVLVLITILIASFMLTKWVERAGTELLADARAGERHRLRREAYSALEVVLAVLADLRVNDQGLFSPAQGWDRALVFAGHEAPGGLTVEVAVTDESGRLSLPRADAATLANALLWAGAARPQAERAAAVLLDWMRADAVPTLAAPRDDYATGPLAYRKAGRPLRSLGELAAVTAVRDLFFDPDGRPTAVLREFADVVSLQDFSTTNLNSAPRAVLAAAGFDETQLAALEQRLRPAGRPATFYRSLAEATPLPAAAAGSGRWGVEAQVLAIQVTVRDGAGVLALAVVVAPVDATAAAPGAAPNPFRILAVEEDPTGPGDEFHG